MSQACHEPPLSGDLDELSISSIPGGLRKKKVAVRLYRP
jgi:hypothetical protein